MKTIFYTAFVFLGCSFSLVADEINSNNFIITTIFSEQKLDLAVLPFAANRRETDITLNQVVSLATSIDHTNEQMSEFSGFLLGNTITFKICKITGSLRILGVVAESSSKTEDGTYVVTYTPFSKKISLDNQPIIINDRVSLIVKSSTVSSEDD